MPILRCFLDKSNPCRDDDDDDHHDDDDDDDDDDGHLIHYGYKDCLSPCWDVEVIMKKLRFSNTWLSKNYITIPSQSESRLFPVGYN